MTVPAKFIDWKLSCAYKGLDKAIIAILTLVNLRPCIIKILPVCTINWSEFVESQ